MNKQNYAKQTQFFDIPENVQMAIKLAKTKNYDNEQQTINYELLFKTKPKQTQSNPIYGEQAQRVEPISSRATSPKRRVPIKLLAYLLINLINGYKFDAVFRVGTVCLKPPAVRFNRCDTIASSIRRNSGWIRPSEYHNYRHTQRSGNMSRAGIIAHHQPGAP